MSPLRPFILLAHGAWHPPHLYDPLKQALDGHGYNLVAPALSTMGKHATGIEWNSDVKVLLDHAEPFFADGQELVLVSHSYGGIPACVATRGNNISERALRGLPGGFRHVVFCAAFVIPEAGLSNLTAIPGAQWMDWHEVIETKDRKQLFVNQKSKEHMYNDLPPEKAQELYESLVPQSYAAVIQFVDFAVPEITNPKTYIVLENDQAFLTSLQYQLSAGLGFSEVSVSGGHSAFASTPEELADALAKISEDGQ